MLSESVPIASDQWRLDETDVKPSLLGDSIPNPDFWLWLDRLSEYRPRRRMAYLIQRAIQQNFIASDRVSLCGSYLIPEWLKGEWMGADFSVFENDTDSRYRLNASVSGVQTCASVWACPLCRVKICASRQKELVALEKAWAQYGDTFMATLTVPHSWGQSLAQVRGATGGSGSKRGRACGVLGAWYHLTRGQPWERFKKKWGIEATVRALEVTYGQNGWHVHLHFEAFCSPLAGEMAESKIKGELHELWSRAIKRAGILGDVSEEHGVDVVACDEGMGSYLVKWGAPAELTGSHVKQGKNGNFTIAQLEATLAKVSEQELSWGESLDLLEEYYQNLQGNRHLTWGGRKDFRRRLKVESQDDQVLAQAPEGQMLASATPRLWEQLRERPGAVADLKSALELGGHAFATMWLEKYLHLDPKQLFPVN